MSKKSLLFKRVKISMVALIMAMSFLGTNISTVDAEEVRESPEKINVALNEDGLGYPKILSSSNADSAKNMTDGIVDFNNRWTNWSPGGIGKSETTNITIQFEELTTIDSVALNFFTDSATKAPINIRIVYLESHSGYEKKVSNQSQSSDFEVVDTDVDTKHTITFDPVDAMAIRIIVKGQPREDGQFKPVGFSEIEVYGHEKIDAEKILNIQMSRTDDEGNPVQNVVYAIFSDPELTNQVGGGRTNFSGKLNVVGFEPGTYYVTETQVPEGYARDTRIVEYTYDPAGKAIQNIEKEFSAPKLADPVENVKELIKKFPSSINAITLEDKTDIVAARTAYNALTTEEQNLVKNTSDDFSSDYIGHLERAEAKIAELEEAALVDTSVLEAKLTEVKEMDLSTYTEETVSNLNDAISSAEEVLANVEATQDQVDAQVTALQRAVDALEEKVTVDKTALQAKITQTKAMDLSKYTDSTVADLNEAITHAEAVLADMNATQMEVDSETTALQRAIDALEEKVDLPVSDYDTALAALRKADASRNAQDLVHATELINSMKTGWQKTRLENRLNVITAQEEAAAAYALALEAVRQADASRTKKDIAQAKALVEALTDGSAKTRLMNQLKTIEAQEAVGVTYEEALAALRTADASRNAEDIEIARDLASQLLNGWQKTRLENRLAVIDSQEA